MPHFRPLHRFAAALVLTAAAQAPVAGEAAAQFGAYGRAGPQVGARVWVENQRDYFRRGDRADVRFSVSDDAYVAVGHIDTEGNFEFLYPASPWDNEFVRGGRIHTLPLRGSAWTVRGRPGIGYFYIVASPTPLDFGAFGAARGSPWDWGYAGRVVRGDPFLAFDQLTRMLLPGWPYAPYAVDYHSYYVEGIHRYPAYACSDFRYSAGWGWSPSYGSCAGMDHFLRQNPYYFDTRRYRGDRRAYLRRYDSLDPRHGFKESPLAPARGTTPGAPRRDERGTTDTPVRTTEPERRPANTGSSRPAAQPAGTSQARPSGDRRPQEGASGSRERPSPGASAAPASGRGGTTTTPERRPARGQP